MSCGDRKLWLQASTRFWCSNLMWIDPPRSALPSAVMFHHVLQQSYHVNPDAGKSFRLIVFDFLFGVGMFGVAHSAYGTSDDDSACLSEAGHPDNASLPATCGSSDLVRLQPEHGQCELAGGLQQQSHLVMFQPEYGQCELAQWPAAAHTFGLVQFPFD